jgi:DNA mismatch repair protein MSH6
MSMVGFLTSSQSFFPHRSKYRLAYPKCLLTSGLRKFISHLNYIRYYIRLLYGRKFLAKGIFSSRVKALPALTFLTPGYKVGRVDQAETALGAEMRLAAEKSKGKVSEDKGKDKIVRRYVHSLQHLDCCFITSCEISELNKVYTNGTLVDADLLTDDQAGHCVSIREEKCADGSDSDRFGICVLDCSTSEFNLSAFEDDVCRTKLETLMRQLRPKELLFTKVGPTSFRILMSQLTG